MNKIDDTISRKTAIDALRAMQTYKLFAGDDMLLIDQAGAQTELMMLPPAQPEPNKGKWIDKGITGDWQYQTDGRGRSWHEWQCDQCKDKVKNRSFYCPNCGADMREVTE